MPKNSVSYTNIGLCSILCITQAVKIIHIMLNSIRELYSNISNEIFFCRSADAQVI